ncbi:MAG: hypothetical protein GXP06_08040 [Alphaproteobacteria bacterium]|nr:hypothetical protein [Alphaproteobacteria bacterium]
MAINSDYMKSLPSDPIEALEKLHEDYLQIKIQAEDHRGWDQAYHREVIHFVAAAKVILKKLDKDEAFKFPPINQSIDDFFEGSAEFFDEVRRFFVEENLELNFTKIEQEFYGVVNENIFIELSDTEIIQIQNKINELRNMVTDTAAFTSKHKQRLLFRLERMQAELHKVMSDMDVFLGGLVDVAAALGRTGDEAKPIFDRFKDIAEILWRRRSDHPELNGPDDMPKLPGS